MSIVTWPPVMMKGRLHRNPAATSGEVQSDEARGERHVFVLDFLMTTGP